MNHRSPLLPQAIHRDARSRAESAVSYAGRLGSLLAGILLATGAGAGLHARPVGSVKALRIDQVTSGIPNPEPGEQPLTREQTLTVSMDGQRLVLDEFSPPATPEGSRTHEVRYVLRLDLPEPVIWKIAPDNSSYREFQGDLNKLQRDREVSEQQIIELVKRRPAREQEKILKERHLRLDGRRVVEVEKGQRKEILGRDCQRYTVIENGRKIIDAYFTDSLKGGRSFFGLYQRLGAFSAQVLEKLKDIPGLPLQATITVVTKLPAYTLEVKVTSIEEYVVPASLFELPPGAERIEETPDVLRCPACGKELEKDKADRRRLGGQLLFFCDRTCIRKYLEERRR